MLNSPGILCTRQVVPIGKTVKPLPNTFSFFIALSKSSLKIKNKCFNKHYYISLKKKKYAKSFVIQISLVTARQKNTKMTGIPKFVRAIAGMIAWQLYLQLSLQSMPITNKFVILNPTHGTVYVIQLDQIKLVSDLCQVGFLQGFTTNKIRNTTVTKYDRYSILSLIRPSLIQCGLS